ncbi:MAG: biotin--[acetyl-CoA-carboxylase] ligase [Faecalibacterium sp.]|jgi:BirA family biotin operon repressor/biotin-[acetyl-CoA-carboxylase] ligase|nr:biotin--[acetyl-CoA-carboxylase] ligase [Faecalibacterium sp.]
MNETLRLLHLDACPSTNAYMKEHPGAFGPLGAVYTTNQTAGRGRLGRAWVNAAGQALYYTVALDCPLAQPDTLPQLSSLLVAQALHERYGVACQIKWPNDLLLGGKKLTGILCESFEAQGRRIWLSGIGINLAQPQRYFDEAGLAHGTSLALAGAAVAPEADAPALAARLTALFAAAAPDFARAGFSPVRDAYRAACVNLGRPVSFPTEGGGTGRGVAEDVDAEGRLVVRTEAGEQAVFTGEVSVSGIYGAV